MTSDNWMVACLISWGLSLAVGIPGYIAVQYGHFAIGETAILSSVALSVVGLIAGIVALYQQWQEP